MNAVWVFVFAGIGAAFLASQLVIAETSYGFAGWVISAFMVGYYARRWNQEAEEEIAKAKRDDDGS